VKQFVNRVGRASAWSVRLPFGRGHDEYVEVNNRKIDASLRHRGRTTMNSQPRVLLSICTFRCGLIPVETHMDVGGVKDNLFAAESEFQT
jgi:hypothetical protein